MRELDVALTDFAIVAESGVFAIAWARDARSRLTDAFTAVFALTAVAAMTGGVVHGFVSDPASLGYRILWPATLIAIIGSSVALVLAALELLESDPTNRRAVWAAALVFCAAVLLGAQSFAVVVAAYVPASLALAYAFARRHGRTRTMRSACGVFALILGIAAGGLQQLRYTPLPLALSHNAFYHVLQMLALALLFLASRGEVPTRLQADA